MRESIHRPSEPAAEAAPLPRWTLSRAQRRCGRCRRPVQAGEAVLLLDEGSLFCELCGQRQWARRWETGDQ